MMVMFSSGAERTTAVPQDLVEQALALGIAVYPVVKRRATVRNTRGRPPAEYRIVTSQQPDEFRMRRAN